MDDRDFLGYFTELGSKNATNLKQAANNIVSTLLALDSKTARKASMDSAASDDKVAKKAKESLKKKYSTGDLGDKMNADLNYTLKRLVKGLNSDNHLVKQGFFIASVMVLNRFKHLVDFDKYIKYIKEETKTNAGMKNPEVHSANMARMMCFSAIIESGAALKNEIVDSLLTIHQEQEFLREAI